ncbi:MAG TPA: hypothetical protein PKL52_01120 [Tenuifilaceae bacterium]|nr:hypothetical protein [Tenuifilaceae bacterium]
MKRAAVILLALCLLSPSTLFSQDKRSLKAAELSYNAAEKDLKKGNYQDAANKFEIVVSSIPEGIDSRKYIVIRLESLIKLVDIYFYKSVNFEKACQNLNLYFSNISKVRNAGVLSTKELFNYLEQEKEFSKEKSQCESYQRVGSDMEKFRKDFDKKIE